MISVMLRTILVSALLLFLTTPAVAVMNARDIADLKRAGISDDTIRAMFREKTIETCAFTVEKIVGFKKAGLSDLSIRILIEENSFMKNSGPIVYGKEIEPLKFMGVEDIMALSEKGVSDPVIRAILLTLSPDIQAYWNFGVGLYRLKNPFFFPDQN